MTEYKKIVFSCFLIFAVLAWFVFAKLLTSAVTYFDLEVWGNFVEVANRIIPILLGCGLFIGLYRNEKSTTYMTEVVAELKKVTWPTSKEVYAATGVVIIAVLIAAVFLGLFDSVWSFLIRRIVQYGG